MSVGDVVTLAVLAFVGYCVWKGRKSGRAKRIANLNALHAAIEGARAEGRAEAAAVAAATGGSVHVHGVGTAGIGNPAEFVPDLDDPRTASLLRAVLQQLDSVPTRDGRLDAHRVGGVLPGVQHGPDTLDRDHLGVRADRAPDGHVPDGGGAQVIRHAAGRVTELS